MAKKVDLTLLKRLVAELESQLDTVEALRTDVSQDKTEMVVEAAKAAGLAAGVMAEAGGLVSDIQHLVEGSQLSKNKAEFLEKLMGSLKGPGSSN